MRFGKRPDGKWFGYSTIADSFYELSLDNEDLLRAVIADCAGDIAHRYIRLMRDGGYDIDDAIRQFRYCNDQPQTGDFWREYFRRCGCSPEQLTAVEARLEQLDEEGDLV